MATNDTTPDTNDNGSNDNGSNDTLATTNDIASAETHAGDSGSGDTGSGDGTALLGAADPGAEAAPTPRKRATRRVTKKAAAPRAATKAGPAPDTTTDVAESAGPEAAAAEGDATPAPVKKAARKRAPRKKAAEAEAQAQAPAEEPTGPVAAALEELVAEVAAADAAPGHTSGIVESEPTPTETDAKVEVDEDEQVTESAGTSTTAIVPSFSVLFQAPDASKATPTRRRRASAPAQEPAQHGPAEPPAPVEVEPEVEEDEEAGVDEADLGDEDTTPRRSRRRRGGKGRRGRAAGDNGEGEDTDTSAEAERAEEEDVTSEAPESEEETTDEEGLTSRRRRRRRRAGSSAGDSADEAPNVSTRVRQPRTQSDEPVAVKGSTRLEAKKQRRREGREAGRRRTVITEAEFLARREAVDRVMVVRNKDGRTQMGVLEDGVLVEHYIDQATNVSMAGNIYLGRVQNVLPSMEAAFVDIGKGRNAVLYAGEVNWDAAGLETNQPKRIENALSSGQTVLVQVTKDPIGHKGARLTSQISLPGRYLVYVPNSSMTGISRKLPDTERARLKKILREVVPDSAGVIVRTAAEGATEEELRADVERLTKTWEDIQSRAEASSSGKAGKSKGRKKNGASGSSPSGTAPLLLHGEPDLTVRVIRDVFNEDFKQLIVAGEQAWDEIHPYISSVAPDLADRVTKWTSEEDLFAHHRVDEQLAKAMDRKVWLPSGGSLVIDRTEAMTVVDVNTGKFVGSGGNLEETVTKNNIEAAEEIVRQLRLRDIGGIIVIDFIDMVLESNRELVVRRLLECLGRDRTKHQVAEVTSLGLVQMTRKRVGSGLIEVFSETCEHCNGRGFIIHTDPVDRGVNATESSDTGNGSSRSRRGRGVGGAPTGAANGGATSSGAPAHAEPRHIGPTAAQIAAAAHAAAIKGASHADEHPDGSTDTHPELASAVDGHPHAFPVDAGPWSGQDVPVEDIEDTEDTADTGAAQPAVELESDVPEAIGAAPESVPGAGAEAATESPSQSPSQSPSEAAEQPVPVSPEPAAAPRGRRRRGRVVAPAGPPRAAVQSSEGAGPESA